jgi:uncharacterized membrane protein
MAAPPEVTERDPGVERIILFSDAVIAIAITLLVLDIKLPDLPEAAGAAALTEALFAIEPKITAYVVSFLVVGLFWYGHYLRFRSICRADSRLIWLNMVFLMTIGFVPFASSVVSEHPNATAFALYDGTMALVALLSAALWGYAIMGDRLVPPGLPPAIRRQSLAGPLLVAGVFAVSAIIAQFDVHAARWSWLLLLPAAIQRPRSGSQIPG